MAWKVDGKIGFLATGQQGGNPQQDTYRILYQEPGQNTQEEIEKVFYLPPGGNPNTDLLLVWRRYWEEQKILVAGNQLVAIKYKPKNAQGQDADVNIQHITIFTNELSTGRSPHIKIMHESGLIVAQVNGDVQGTQETKYNLVGNKHTATINQTTLYAGQTYYIVYSPGYGGGSTFYPAYFQDSTDKGAYKVYENETSNETVYDMSDSSPDGTCVSKYKGIWTNTERIFELNEGDWFVWMGSSSIMDQAKAYFRSSTGTSGNYTFTGSIGETTYHTLTVNDLQTLINKLENQAFIWYVDNSALTRGSIYYRNSVTAPYGVDVSSAGSQQPQLSQAIILNSMYSHNNNVIMTDGYFWHSSTFIGTIFKLKSGYTNKVSSMTPITSTPADVQDGDVYYTTGSLASYYENCIAVYNNGTWSPVVSQNPQQGQISYTQVFDTSDNYSLLVGYICKDSELISKVIDTQHSSFMSATVNTDKKFYLELDGNETPDLPPDN